MQSDKGQYYFFKYCLLGLGLIFIVASVAEFLGYLEPDADVVHSAVFGLIGVLMILIFLLIKDKFALVELSGQTITIIHKGKENIVIWEDIERIDLIKGVTPLLYRLQLKGSMDTVWFTTRTSYVEVGDFARDISDMGALIRKKKDELGI